MGRTKPTIWTLYRCPKCNGHIEIQRLSGYRKKSGHLKLLWCPTCQAEVNCIQVQESLVRLERVLSRYVASYPQPLTCDDYGS